jgi:hypothetical protein
LQATQRATPKSSAFVPSHTNEFALLSLLYLVVRSVMRFIVWSLRSRDAQALEVMVLRHQLEVLNRHVSRALFGPTTASCSPPPAD